MDQTTAPPPSRKKERLNIDELAAERCRRSFYFFVQYFWDTIIAEDPIWNWHIEYLCKELEDIGRRVSLVSRGTDPVTGKPTKPVRLPKLYDYYIINIPPGSSKSTIVSEMYPIWNWIIDPTQKFICGSYSSTIAEDIAGKSYNIYTSAKFMRTFPKLAARKVLGGKTHFKNGFKGERYTTSAGSAIQGIHAHQKILDDPIGQAQAHSEADRKTVNVWLSETISTRNIDATITTTIIVMQRLHEQDPTGYLLGKAGLNIKHICIPAEISPDVKPESLRANYIDGLFDVKRKPRERLNMEKIELGSYGYAGQMQQRPAPAEGGIIKKEWFHIVNEPPQRAPGRVFHFQLDTAYTEDTENDPTGIAGYYVDGNYIYITNAQSVWKEFPELCRWLPPFARENFYTDQSMINVEPKATGKSLVQTIRDGTALNISESKAPKEDKSTRLHIVSPKIEAGRIRLHAGGWNESFISQLTAFPNAAHDEYVDILVAIIDRELMIGETDEDVLSMFK